MQPHAQKAYASMYTRAQDFYNLVDVYMDAVFHPKCIEDEQTFQQEGWHFELDNKEVCVCVGGEWVVCLQGGMYVE